MRRWLIAVLLASCDGPPDQAHLDGDFEAIVLQRASREFPCATDQLEVEALGGEAYRATGCGDYATYECAITDNDGEWLEACERAAHDGPSRVDAGM